MQWGADGSSQPVHEVTERRGVLVPMRDGTRLSVDIHLPTTPEPVPVILTITPYDNNNTRPEARWWAARGYAFVAVDVRGRYDSEGDFDPFDARHKTDGYDVVEWIAEEAWSTGRVGMVGASYCAWTQWWTASTAPPHLVAIAPAVGQPDQFENIPYQNGVIAGWLADWSAGMSGRAFQINETSWSSGAEDAPPSPFIDTNRRRGYESTPWFEEMYRRTLSTDPYWEGISYQSPAGFERIQVPALCVTGWFDCAHAGSPLNYRGMADHGGTEAARRPMLVIGPWNHTYNQPVADHDYGPEAVIDLDGLTLRWYDYHLKGIDTGIQREDPVRTFVMGADTWRSAPDWPLPDTDLTRLYLTARSGANSSRGDGELVDAPATEGSDSYLYDPRTPTVENYDEQREHGGLMMGPVDTRQSASGAEVLVYTTPPLTDAVEVIGPLEAVIYASTSARDTDWYVRLVDIHPDGTSLLLADGALRARSSDPSDDGRFSSSELFDIEPDEIRRYTVRFWRGTANRFELGHRIGVEISSSWYPYYYPNFNTGADNLATVELSDAVSARQTIYHGPSHPSHILLPVVR
jgi:uncharacterized protein